MAFGPRNPAKALWGDSGADLCGVGNRRPIGNLIGNRAAPGAGNACAFPAAVFRPCGPKSM